MVRLVLNRSQKVVYYEAMKREVKTRPICECRSDERLKTKVEELIDEMLVSVMGESVFLK